MRHTSLHVSQKHSHGCHCTTGDFAVFQACTALTKLNLASDPNSGPDLTGKAKETYHPQAHLTHIESRLRLSSRTTLLPRSITPLLFCAVLWCVCGRA